MLQSDIDFAQIRPFDGDRRKGFEQFVCQLAKRTPPEGAREFRRIEGSGGDGGLEAYWILNDNSKVGYQAKYFLRTGDIDWNQVDNSVSEAMDQYPELILYCIAFPCDLTGRMGTKGKGKSGWEHWESHLKKWKESSKRKGLSIVFKPWTKDEMMDRLINIEDKGLVEYWFNRKLISFDWLCQQFQHAVQDLGDRYQPEDHVEVGAERLLDGVACTDRFRLRVVNSIINKNNLQSINECLSKLNVKPESGIVQKVNDTILDSIKAQEEFVINITNEDFLRICSQSIANASKELAGLENWIWSHERAKENDPNRLYDLQRSRSFIEKIRDDLNYAFEQINSPEVMADVKRVAIVSGGPGTGKSHLAASVVERLLKDNIPAILVLGQYIIADDIWDSIFRRLEIHGITPSVFLGSMNCHAESLGKRCLFVIDALNEAGRINSIPSQISSFIGKFEKFEHVALCITVRNEYLEKLIPLNGDFPTVRCIGFVTIEEQEAAARQYIEKRGITRPSAPWLNPEFINPLFLRICCNALKNKGVKNFPRGLRGAKEVFGLFIESLEIHLKRVFPSSVFRDRAIRLVIMRIAKEMAVRKSDCIPRDKCNELTVEIFGTNGPNISCNWTDILVREGVLRCDHVFSDEPDDLFSVPNEFIRFSYQRFSDHLIVMYLLNDSDDADLLFSESGPLNFLLYKNRFNFSHYNLLAAAAMQLPEKFDNCEFLDLVKDGRRYLNHDDIREIFLSSLLWRSETAFSDRTLELFNQLSCTNYSCPQIEILCQLSMVPRHPWNADFLDKNLRNKSMSERDACWTNNLRYITDTNHPLYVAIMWSLRADLSQSDPEVLRLLSILFVWSFSATNRRIRDLATKGLTRIFCQQVNLVQDLLVKFYNVNDLYILERLLAAAFGAASQLDPGEHLTNWSVCLFFGSFPILPSGRPKQTSGVRKPRSVLHLADVWPIRSKPHAISHIA